MASLRTHIFAKGERYPMLQDEAGVPLYFPTLYATAQLRNAGSAVATIRNRLTDIKVLLEWERLNARSLESEFSKARFLSLADISSLRDFAKLDQRDVQSAASRNNKIRRIGDGLHWDASAKSIGSQQHYNRLTTFADYLEFIAIALNLRRNDSGVSAEISRMGEMIRRHRPRSKSRADVDDPDTKSPPSEIIDAFMAVAAIDHPENPFRSPAVRHRNAMLFGILRNTGIRKGELLSLRVDQMDLGEHAGIWVRRNQDDEYDRRKDQPVAKTKERLVPISDELAAQIREYILEFRVRVPGARSHPYLLVSHRSGAPLSLSAVGSQIMDKMRLVRSEFCQIHPHSFRHHFNYELSLKIDEINTDVRLNPAEGGRNAISAANEMDIRAYLNGHRSRRSGEVYNRRHLREISDRAVRAVQSAIKSGRSSRFAEGTEKEDDGSERS